MIKLVFTIRRRADVEPEEFHRYWREEHGPLVARLAETLRVRRYVQTHTLDTPLTAAVAEPRGIESEPYDGVAELWWDSADEIVAAVSTDEGQAAAAELLADEARFIDLPACSIFLGEEHEVIGDGDRNRPE